MNQLKLNTTHKHRPISSLFAFCNLLFQRAHLTMTEWFLCFEGGHMLSFYLSKQPPCSILYLYKQKNSTVPSSLTHNSWKVMTMTSSICVQKLYTCSIFFFYYTFRTYSKVASLKNTIL